MGVQCEFSTCSGGKGVYHIDTDTCRCLVGYEGKYCDKCAPSVYPSVRKIQRPLSLGGAYMQTRTVYRLCLLVPERDQPVPEGVFSSKPATPVEALMLKTGAATDLAQLRAGDRAPMFVTTSIVGVEEAEAWLAGSAHSGGPDGARDIIKPMSVHLASGYWYDCACRLAPHNGTASVKMEPPELFIGGEDDASVDGDAADVNTVPSTPILPLPPKAGGDGDSADIPIPSIVSTISGGDGGEDGMLPMMKDKKTKKRRSLRLHRERVLAALRAAATLSEFRALTQAIMDEWDKMVDTTTASAVVITDAIDDVIDGLQFNAGFGIIFPTFMWSGAIVLMASIPAALFCMHRFGQGM